MNTDAIDALRNIVGAEGVLTTPNDIAPYVIDHRRLYQGAALAVVRPRDVAGVARVVAWCHQHAVAVVPQGGNTGYCGGATPDESGTQIVLALGRLNRVRSVDTGNFSMVAEAGCTLAQVQKSAGDAERYFPLSIGSEGTCQLGGNLATNAGGINVLRYGMMRDLTLGLEVVLADGRLLDTLTTLRKDNTGYDVKGLFIGSEGTLGIITAASLKLFPKPIVRATAFVAVSDVTGAVDLLGVLREASGDRVSSFELVPRVAIDLTTRHVSGVADPVAGAYAWYVLCELTSSRDGDPLDAMLEAALREAMDAGLVQDAVLAQNERQRAAFWRLRESIPEAQRLNGASLKHDVSVPIMQLARFVAEGSAWLQAHVPDGVLVAYGHVGDGNLHFNVSQSRGSDLERFAARADDVRRAIHDLVHALGGSSSAEHGIGRLKIDELARYAPAVELELMRAIKRVFDPRGILNPGKVLAS